jgi:hypothetical protein
MGVEGKRRLQKMKELTNKELFAVQKTIAWELISRFEYPYQVLPEISEYIVALGNQLSSERFEQRGENIWIAKSRLSLTKKRKFATVLFCVEMPLWEKALLWEILQN